MKQLKIYSWLVTALTFFAGVLLVATGFVEYGFSLFIIFPIAIGFAAGLSVESGTKVVWINLGSVLLALVLTAIFALEGVICILMASPLIVLLQYVGYWTAQLVKRRWPRSTPPSNVNAFFIPLLILLVSDFAERKISGADEINAVTSSVTLAFTPEQVFDHIKAMDKLDAEKTFLLKLGLPVPNRCVIEEDKVGAKRTCLFDDGRIVTEVTRFERGQALGLKVMEYELAGKRWFTFHGAEYQLRLENGKTILTRTTTYQSTLQPRFYWAPIEKFTIEQEHAFVFRSLEKNLNEKF